MRIKASAEVIRQSHRDGPASQHNALESGTNENASWFPLGRLNFCFQARNQVLSGESRPNGTLWVSNIRHKG